MRKQSDVNDHRMAHRQRERSNGAFISFPRTLDEPEVRPVQYDKAGPDHHWQEWFLPRKETRLMTDEANRSGGLFLPYPLLGILMTLILALGGGIIGMYVKVDTLSTALLMQDANYQRERQQAWDKIEQLQVYITNDREKIIRLEEQLNKQRTRQ